MEVGTSWFLSYLLFLGSRYKFLWVEYLEKGVGVFLEGFVYHLVTSRRVTWILGTGSLIATSSQPFSFSRSNMWSTLYLTMLGHGEPMWVHMWYSSFIVGRWLYHLVWWHVALSHWMERSGIALLFIPSYLALEGVSHSFLYLKFRVSWESIIME